MTRFDDGYETVILPGEHGPPVPIQSTIEAFEQTVPGMECV